jgi:hypothetical protein
MLLARTVAHAQEVAAVSSTDPSSDKDQGIGIARPAIHVATRQLNLPACVHNQGINDTYDN